MNPEAMLVTTLTLACLGLAVMLLTRPRTEQCVPGDASEGEIPGPAEAMNQMAAPPSTMLVSPGGNQIEVTRAKADEQCDPQMTPRGGLDGELQIVSATADPGSAGAEHAKERGTNVRQGEEVLLEPVSTGAVSRGAALGASALIAKVATLLPAGVASTSVERTEATKPARVASGFQPGARFSRSQQAFLRIPITLSGRDETGNEFQEETWTQILLPQGAVIPMKRKVRAGDRLMLSNPTRQKEVACQVFGTQTGPDGRILVEVEFPEPQKGMWPVVFPAWSGKSPGRRTTSHSASVAARTPTLDSSDT